MTKLMVLPLKNSSSAHPGLAMPCATRTLRAAIRILARTRRGMTDLPSLRPLRRGFAGEPFGIELAADPALPRPAPDNMPGGRELVSQPRVIEEECNVILGAPPGNTLEHQIGEVGQLILHQGLAQRCFLDLGLSREIST